MKHSSYSAAEISAITGGQLIAGQADAVIESILTDSRKLSDLFHGLFFALRGRRDGHVYIREAYDAGVRNFVISDPGYPTGKFTGANFFIVNDTLHALQQLAAAHRQKFAFPVIGITGSNGKTIVKEWLSQLLASDHHIVRSPKSYNSQLGVPLSVWGMNGEHTLAIFEAGISKAGEMDDLEKVIRPTIGVLTNIGNAHREGFDSPEQHIAEKLKLFRQVGLFVYPGKYLKEYRGTLPGLKQFSWSFGEPADLQIIRDRVSHGNERHLTAIVDGIEVEATVPFKDSASVENAVSCWATMIAMGYDASEAAQRLAILNPVGMRLELKSGFNNCSVIDDSYSLDLSSLNIAIDFLTQQRQHPKRTLILSDIPGIRSPEVYAQLMKSLSARAVDRLIGVGELLSQHGPAFEREQHFFASTGELLSALPALGFSNEAILLKGARSFGFERISRLLTQKVHETVLEIDLNALEYNLSHYRSLLKPDTRIMAMVKAFAYGSGSSEIANLLQFNRVDYLAVAFADEGVALRNAGLTLPIMVMSPDQQAFEVIISHRLEPEIYSQRILNEFLQILHRRGISNYPIHIKLDTGMHRLGFMEDELDELLATISDDPGIRVNSVFSHLAASEDPVHDDFTRGQISMFRSMSERVAAVCEHPVIRHLSNTSGISRWPEASFDMVRLGIGLYGIDSAKIADSPLQTVTSLKTRISQIKTMAPGETVGYGREGVLPNGGRIATVKVGYADGYDRRLGNGVGTMLIHGKAVRTIGRICMDMCMLDISGIDASEGDEVIVFNSQIRVEELAQRISTSAYEILTGISQRVKRVYYYE